MLNFKSEKDISPKPHIFNTKIDRLRSPARQELSNSTSPVNLHKSRMEIADSQNSKTTSNVFTPVGLSGEHHTFHADDAMTNFLVIKTKRFEKWKNWEETGHVTSFLKLQLQDFIHRDWILNDISHALTVVKKHTGFFTHFCEFFDIMSKRIIEFHTTNHILTNFDYLKNYHAFSEQAYLYLIVERRYVNFLRNEKLYEQIQILSKIELMLARFHHYTCSYIKQVKKAFLDRIDI